MLPHQPYSPGMRLMEYLHLAFECTFVLMPFKAASASFYWLISYLFNSKKALATHAIFSMGAGWLNLGKRRRDDSTSSMSLRAPSINF